MDISVLSDVNNLANHLSRISRRRIESRQAKAIIFERILTCSAGKKSDVVFPLAQFSYYFRWKGSVEKADTLDSSVEQLYKMPGFPAGELQTFLMNLANVNETEKPPTAISKPKLFTFSQLPSSLSPLKGPKKRLLPFEMLQIPTIGRLPDLETATSFPLLPSCCREADKDEGFSDSSSPLPDGQYESVSSVIPRSITPPLKKQRREPVLVSEMNARDFDSFWQEYLQAGPFRLLSSAKLAEASSIATSFLEFARCFQALVFGIGSWMFPLRNEQFELAPGIRVIEISAGTYRNLMVPYIELGNSILEMGKYTALLENVQRQTLRGFRLGIIDILRRYQWETSQSGTKPTGVLDLVRRFDKYIGLFKHLELLCSTVWARFQSKDLTATWLLDTLFELCRDLRFSSTSSAYLFTLFEHALHPQLQYLDSLMTDVEKGRESRMEETFLKLDEDAFALSDRKFWTTAVTLRPDEIPTVFSPLANNIHWTIKVNCLLHRLDIEGPIVDDPKEKFSLINLVSDSAYKTINGRTVEELQCDYLDRFQAQLSQKWRGRMETMKDFFVTRGIFGKRDILSVCSDLRSIFLLENGDFGSIVVQELFNQMKNGDQSVFNAKEFFDVYSLNRILETALQCTSLKTSVAKLDLSFVITSDNESNPSGYLSIFEHLQLSCDVPWPANIVLTPSVIAWYRKPFGFLLKLKLTLWTLTESRTRLLDYSKRGFRLHRTLIRLREIDLFARNLETYLLHQVDDVSWTTFVNKTMTLEDGEEFDMMYHLHNRYVTDFINRCLLNPKARKIFSVVEALLRYATDFGMIAVTFLEKSDGACASDGTIEDGIMAMDTIYAKFVKALKLFYFLLSKLASRGYQPHLADLLLRMNYNYYYDSDECNSTNNSE